MKFQRKIAPQLFLLRELNRRPMTEPATSHPAYGTEMNGEHEEKTEAQNSPSISQQTGEIDDPK